MTGLAGDELIDGDSGADVGGALFHAHAGEERSVGARVVAGAVFAGVGVAMVKPSENLDAFAMRDERFERRAWLELGADSRSATTRTGIAPFGK